MSVSSKETFNKQYQKYKFIVKKWEKEFVSENGRVPSKHDIKEASHYVRTAYKYYFNLKSEILESSISDIFHDNECFSSSEIDVSTALENSDCVNNDSENDFPKIPSCDEIKKLLDTSQICLTEKKCTSNEKSINDQSTEEGISSRIWGSHLNNKKKEPKKSALNKVLQKNTFSSELFKSCSFKIRNPRKSLSSSKSLSKVDPDNTVTNESNLAEAQLTENLTIDQTTEDFIKSKEYHFSSINSVQIATTQKSSSLRNIDPGWLSRCIGVSSHENIGTNIQECDLQKTVSSTDNLCKQTCDSRGYGLKNLKVCPLVPKLDESHLSDFVENSESECEPSQTKNMSYRKIRPVVKRCKLESIGSQKTSTMSSNKTLNVIQELNDGNVPSDQSDEATGIKKKKKKVTKPREKRIKRTNGATESRSKQQPKKTSLRRKAKVKTILTSDSEYDDQEVLPVKTVKRSKRKVALSSKSSKYHENNEVHKEYENDYVGEEMISYPRFPISSSILKENNLIDGFATVIEIPKNSKVCSAKSNPHTLTEEEKLKKKIDDGRLNENFVRINLEKKVYVRGKKTVNFSKFKKQMWKNKKKLLHETPEFPEGGILRCFKCGQPGHMSRYCKSEKGGSLLALEDCHENSSLLSIQEAETLNNDQYVPKVSESVIFECINKDISENDTDGPSKSDNIAMKGIHPISETFIKLLAAPHTNTSSAQLSVEPLYKFPHDGSLMDTPEEVIDALHLFGHSEFRNGQERAIMRILCGQSTLVTLSTGSGKSLCYQLPAYLYAKQNKCITLVISPLVSLMEDQVTSMPSFVHASCLHTNQTPVQREKIIELIKNGDIHILLISPEAIVAGERSTGFGAILRQLPPIAFACIDEVHCVSQWSHNFRPSYLMICRVLREKLGVRCILGLTATATKPTVSEIIQHLQISDGINNVITNKPLPDNLVLTVSRDSQRDHRLLGLLQSERFSHCNSIIVYCIRRDECERVASLIRSSMQDTRPASMHEKTSGNNKRKRSSWIVEAYHAGMSAAKRRRVQQAFMCGDLKIVVATVAFGMGINKSDIRGVIHYNMPSSFESYVQEVGRAGRDGLPAQCHVFIDNEFKDKDELLRHIHANSIERHVIRKLLQKIFIPCGCSKIMKNIPENSENSNTCPGHEVAFSIDETVAELDIPSENISTLLCYLELHPKKFAKVLSNVYVTCKIISYGGLSCLLKAAEKCPPLAMAIALKKKNCSNLDNSGNIEFCVIEVSAAIGWESGVVKYHLKGLEWNKQNGVSKKSLLRVEFHTLGFRVKSPGDLTSSELDNALDSLYERTQLQEKSMLHQLQEVSKALSDVAFPTILKCFSSKDEETYIKCSNDLKEVIRNYFECESFLKLDNIKLDDRPINKEQVIGDVRGLLSTYRDCTFTGRAVARILQGISSPNFPALVWGRCRYWRSHLSSDFYKLENIAKQQIISMR